MCNHMSAPTANESWIIDAGGKVIEKKARSGADTLSQIERLIYCLWIADYGMCNAGDLETAHDLYADFQQEAARLARELGLQRTLEAFSLQTAKLEQEYFDRFEEICDEIRRYS